MVGAHLVPASTACRSQSIEPYRSVPDSRSVAFSAAGTSDGYRARRRDYGVCSPVGPGYLSKWAEMNAARDAAPRPSLHALAESIAATTRLLEQTHALLLEELARGPSHASAFDPSPPPSTRATGGCASTGPG